MLIRSQLQYSVKKNCRLPITRPSGAVTVDGPVSLLSDGLVATTTTMSPLCGGCRGPRRLPAGIDRDVVLHL